MKKTAYRACRGKTPRQVQDFRNGYEEGYLEARHGETSVGGRFPSPEHATGVRQGLKDGSAPYNKGKAGRDLNRVMRRFCKARA